jgi:hypothetical protein
MIRRLSLLVAVAVAMLALPSAAPAARTIDVSPQLLAFGEQPYHTFATKAFTVTNVSKKPVAVSVETGFVPDDFSPGQPASTCATTGSTTLAGGQSCSYVIGYYADPAAPFLGDRRIDLRVVARAAKGKATDTKTVAVTATPVAPAEVLGVEPDSVSFGEQPFETFEMRTFTVTNVWSHTIALTSDAGLPDDFSHLIYSTCGLGDRTLTAGESCTHVVGFRPSEFFAGLETATVVLTARDQATGTFLETRTVEITGTGVPPAG